SRVVDPAHERKVWTVILGELPSTAALRYRQSQLGHFRPIQPVFPARPVFTLAKISQQFFFRSPPAFARNSPQTFVDHGRVVPGTAYDAPRSPGPGGAGPPGPPCRWRLPGGGDGNIKG